MPNFYLTVGCSAGGKTTWARHICGVVLESDDLREELYGDWSNQEHNNEIFMEMRKRTIAAMRENEDVCYVATNLSLKRRSALVHELRQLFPHYTYNVYVFVASFTTLLDRNDKRTHRVPCKSILKQFISMQLPVMAEGWDNIEVINEFKTEYEQRSYYNKVMAEVMRFGSQRNPHHTLTLVDHLNKCACNAAHSSNLNVITAAALHDIGKPSTCSVDNDGIYHYYGHASVGAQLALLSGISYDVAVLICYHMITYEKAAPHMWQARLGNDLWTQLQELHIYDEEAH